MAAEASFPQVRRSSHRRITVWRCAVLAALLVPALLVPAAARAAPPAVSVFPSPGTRYNLPAQQIVFRGVPASQIGPVQVVGSVSGVHTGQIEGDSDGDGGSFLPDKPFMPGETVTVTTALDVIGASSGKFSFSIAQPGHPLAFGTLPVVSAGSNGLQHFRSRPDLEPASLTVTSNATPASYGDIFIAPQFGPTQDGPMIVDPRGNLVWFLPYSVRQNMLITDFRVQNLYGQPVLTWWQGNTNNGHGRGEGIIFNRSYQQVAAVHAADGLDMDLHEFLVTPQGDAYINATSPVRLPGIGKRTIDCVVQEIDIKTGLVLFEWHALDHVGLGESDFTPKSPGYNFDPFHVNSVALDRSGNLLVSMRDTSAVYDLSRTTGAINWRLGGKRSSFKMGTGTMTAFQHDAVLNADGTITMFDDGAGPPTLHAQSRGIRVALDTKHMTVSLVKEYDHSPAISANFEGSAQSLPQGDVFLGWGQQPYFSEDDQAGKQDFDAHFNSFTSSYRAYRFPWAGTPTTPPALAVSPGPNGTIGIYASWNGATSVSSWRVLNGPSASDLTPVGTAAAHGFETAIDVRSAAPYFAVQALGSSGQLLASSGVSPMPDHLTLYGTRAFVSVDGVGAVPAGCLMVHPCQVKMTLSAGRTVIARTSAQGLGADSGGMLFFSLSAAGRRMLARADAHGLPVQVAARDASGITTSATIDLIPYSVRGPGPARSVSPSQDVQVISTTEFVSRTGVGDILVGCSKPTPCRVSATLTVGGSVIGRTRAQFLGADELGYLTFTLNALGRSKLSRAPGNQLGAQLAVSGPGGVANASVALVRFS